MMSDFVTLLETLFNNVRASECLRERIAKRPSFNKTAAFKYCDMDDDGRVSVQDIMDVLCENNGGTIATEKEALLIINKFKGINIRCGGGSNMAGLPPNATISLKEYIEEITPKIEENI